MCTSGYNTKSGIASLSGRGQTIPIPGVLKKASEKIGHKEVFEDTSSLSVESDRDQIQTGEVVRTPLALGEVGDAYRR